MQASLCSDYLEKVGTEVNSDSTMKAAVVLALLSLVSVEGWLFSDDAEWNDLKVTFGLNQLFSSTVFDSMPRTEQDAQNAGWVDFSRGASCDDSFYRGSRYIKDNEPAVMLLFDTNGYVAGIQMGVKKNELPAGLPSDAMKHMWNDDGDLYVITAYFIIPATVCTGRSEALFTLEGTGEGLYIQNGPNPESDYQIIPRDEADIGTTQWTQGECFYTMGQHYWYNVTTDMSCDNFYPVFLLYNSGRLNGFGWNIKAYLDSPRYEHPTTDILDMFFKVIPQCFYDEADPRGATTLHIYMDSAPSFNFC
ncbi:Hypp1874 [Branchiostoma lanceolatum]|uniref:Hypp1874 protein n=1 Tax=Branchiostoma lanceolatum TaxID=7740 RepID=A0A8K0EMR1_BRALA|nr:Hypp1874 [Branchiostoma lanceolatum]